MKPKKDISIPIVFCQRAYISSGFAVITAAAIQSSCSSCSASGTDHHCLF